ncbi:hypothetical protein CALCODRAFT_301231 [Calocera cornea HHB12733]|uniref:Uncharacterized protein n=1 Tax=Calocera cornea HHB12733 TaxID=1353952 RepID=A0A165FHV1_9BASI|nr:hypothetical protein CALCODRAFT_301231 [Calocera cornea HHB12733]
MGWDGEGRGLPSSARTANRAARNWPLSRSRKPVIARGRGFRIPARRHQAKAGLMGGPFWGRAMGSSDLASTQEVGGREQGRQAARPAGSAIASYCCSTRPCARLMSCADEALVYRPHRQPGRTTAFIDEPSGLRFTFARFLQNALSQHRLPAHRPTHQNLPFLFSPRSIQRRSPPTSPSPAKVEPIQPHAAAPHATLAHHNRPHRRRPSPAQRPGPRLPFVRAGPGIGISGRRRKVPRSGPLPPAGSAAGR